MKQEIITIIKKFMKNKLNKNKSKNKSDEPKKKERYFSWIAI